MPAPRGAMQRSRICWRTPPASHDLYKFQRSCTSIMQIIVTCYTRSAGRTTRKKKTCRFRRRDKYCNCANSSSIFTPLLFDDRFYRIGCTICNRVSRSCRLIFFHSLHVFQSNFLLARISRRFMSGGQNYIFRQSQIFAINFSRFC